MYVIASIQKRLAVTEQQLLSYFLLPLDVCVVMRLHSVFFCTGSNFLAMIEVTYSRMEGLLHSTPTFE